MSASTIEWTDVTWNPVVGCTRVSAGCDNCYAVTMTRRLEAMGQEKYAGLVNPNKGHFNGVVRPHVPSLLAPLGWKKPRLVFVNSMSDLFHKDVPFDFIDEVFAVMALADQHTFQVLTKRPERMAEYLASNPTGLLCDGTQERVARIAEEVARRRGEEIDEWWDLWLERWPLQNVWLGTSCENQATANERIPHLLRCPAAVRFLSCEPLLGPLDIWASVEKAELSGVLEDGYFNPADPRHLHWVIAGGESGPGARPVHPDWIRKIRDDCALADVPFHFKQWGAWHPNCLCDKRKACNTTPRPAPGKVGVMFRCGKHAGRKLDGRTHDANPLSP